jgi:hypothetical protein
MRGKFIILSSRYFMSLPTDIMQMAGTVDYVNVINKQTGSVIC